MDLVARPAPPLALRDLQEAPQEGEEEQQEEQEGDDGEELQAARGRIAELEAALLAAQRPRPLPGAQGQGEGEGGGDVVGRWGSHGLQAASSASSSASSRASRARRGPRDWVVEPWLLSKLLQRRQRQQVDRAGLEGLVDCPFEYATVMEGEADRVLVCRKPDCGGSPAGCAGRPTMCRSAATRWRRPRVSGRRSSRS
jgi:hypothetical protein